MTMNIRNRTSVGIIGTVVDLNHPELIVLATLRDELNNALTALHLAGSEGRVNDMRHIAEVVHQHGGMALRFLEKITEGQTSLVDAHNQLFEPKEDEQEKERMNKKLQE